MKLSSEQKTRLVSLLVMVAASSALSESENAEMNFLTGIAQKSGEFSDVLRAANQAKAASGEAGDQVDGEAGDQVDGEAGKTDDQVDGEKSQGPTTREKIGAKIAGSPANAMAANRVLTAENGRLKAELAQAKSQIASGLERIGTLEGENKTLASKDKSARDAEVQSHVVDELASVGQPEETLASNSSTGGSHDDQLDDIRAQIAGSTDPKEKGRLAMKARNLRLAASLN
jgi:hypothetical protein